MSQVTPTLFEMGAGLVIGIVVGIALGGLVAALLVDRRASSEKMNLQGQLQEARTRLNAEQNSVEQWRAAYGDRDALLQYLTQQMEALFGKVSSQALGTNSEQFLNLAKATLGEATQKTSGKLDEHKTALTGLLGPFSEAITKLDGRIDELEKARVAQSAALGEQLKSLTTAKDELRNETRNLVTALRSPTTKGNWGQKQLRNVVEMAGMIEHCDFAEQVTVEGEEGRLRPDVVVNLPGGRHIAVDSKAPIDAFLNANDATDEESRRAYLKGLASNLRAHVDDLAKKAYWRAVDDSLDFVVAFVPGDHVLSVAFESDPALYGYAMDHQVLFASPTSLIALLHAASYGWRQEALAENARAIQELGAELYRRIIPFTKYMDNLGRNLNRVVDAHNSAVGSLERKILPQARRFRDLGAVGTGAAPMIELNPVDHTARSTHISDATIDHDDDEPGESCDAVADALGPGK